MKTAASLAAMVLATLACAQDLRVGHHTFRVAAAGLEILTDGKVAKRVAGENLSLGPFDDAPPGWRNGRDINGDKIPEVIVREDTGGAHCCTSWRIFRAGVTVEQIFVVNNGHTDFFPFADLNHDGKLEIKLYDWTFAYWHAGFAESPAIVLVYAWTKGKYEFSPELTKRPPWSPAKMKKRAAGLHWKGPGIEGVPPDFWSAILDLIGTGNAAQVPAYIDLAWPAKRPGRAEFLAEFYQLLHASKHWQDLDRLNGGAAVQAERQKDLKVSVPFARGTRS